MSDKGYKRSWKNLLLNKRYQLRFTLFMVGLSAVLMVVLGIWVMQEANEATRVGMNGVIEKCVEIPQLVAEETASAGDVAPTPMAVDEASAIGSKSGSGAGTAPGSGTGSGEERHVQVEMTDSTMTLVPVLAPDFGEKVRAHWTCMSRYWGSVDLLRLGRTRILWVLVASGLVLVLGLAMYGIKMTHRVAGPLFKVGLYFGKMRDGRFDKVYNLRKGDQLVDFYDHFKVAHAGIVTREHDDIARLKEIVAAAEAAGQGDHDATKQLREMIARKEKSLE